MTRHLFSLACVGLALVASPATYAQDYPTRPITLVVSFAPGGLSDIPARFLAAELQKTLSQSVIVENKPGASGITGGAAVWRAAPDGYTLLVNAISEVQNLHYLSVPYNAVTDFTNIAKVADGPSLVLIVKTDSPYQSVKDIIADAKAHPDKINFATSGPATSPAIAVSQLNAIAGTKIVDVAYRGTGPAAAAVMAGEVQGAFVFYGSAKPLVDGGKVRALAIASSNPVKGLENVPTMADQGFKGFEHTAFVGLAGPPNLPLPIVERLNKAVNEAVHSASFRASIEPLGMVAPAGPNTPETFTDFMRKETERQAELAKLTGHRKQ
jgi:tripartite-type tricarboxylate transporter receptor subunit TctC